MRMRVVLSLSAALLVLLAAPAVRAAGPTACQVFPSQTASTLLGSPVGLPVDMAGIGCGYSNKDASATATVTVVDQPALTAEEFQKSINMLAAGGGAKAETISGLGEANAFWIRPGNQNSISVLYHHKMISLAVQKAMTPALKSAMIDTIRQIVSKF